MRVLVLADIHFDMWEAAGRDPFAALPAADWTQLDAVIVAGDLANKPKVRWKTALRHLSQYIAPELIHVFPGNHDYYDFHLDGDDRLAQITSDEGVQFAQKSVIEIGSARFLCCTLWTDFALRGDDAGARAAAQNQMNDYRYIRHAGRGYRRIHPGDTAAVHADHREWLEARLAEPHTGPTIVVTHHCPHPDLIAGDPVPLDAAYASDLTAIIRRHRPAAWLYGHTHHPAEIRVGSTWVRNVSLGYPDQTPPDVVQTILRRGLIDLTEPDFGIVR
ncbi:Calcineurin-like phosphoesterase [Monaibacterium marinum]|uniref:Calcineurin-like phosphoesterase n=1 Tax=Pontivivens marinum TaxID=1690039 RepID=A0A2C9CR03_9RHOB|nr:metallophosphoesterase [Monaibacterium marinum]SOH93981.1 Calcineurin-like phosphoesterase [Monaibacterium marinum]